jgi:hypothetical protein
MADRKKSSGNLAKLKRAKVIDAQHLSAAHRKVIDSLSDEEVKMLIDLKKRLGGGAAWAPFTTKEGWVAAL